AEVHQRRGKLADAEAGYREALRLKPAYPEALNDLGTLLRDRDNIPGARTCFEEVIRLDPNFRGVYNNLGACYIYEGRPADAVSYLRQALSREPNSAAILGNLGTLARDGLYRFADEEIARVRTLLASGKLDTDERATLCFTLAN